jgi:hypothetical protein
MPRASRSSQRFARNTEKVTRSHKNTGSIEKEATHLATYQIAVVLGAG